MSARKSKSGAGNKKDAGNKDAVAHLLAETRAGAEKVEEGNFRLDWTRALDKVKRFQLTDPHRYVLELAQCAIASGASYIDVYTDSDDVIMSYDAPVHEHRELRQLFDYLFAQDSELLAAKQLALAVNSALALEPKFIVVDSGDGETGHRLRLSSHDDVSIEALSDDDMVVGTRVHVRDRISWDVLLDLFRARTLEGKHLGESCSLAPIPVRLNGQDVVKDFAPNALAQRGFSRGKGAKKLRGVVALPDRPRESAELHVLMNGVRVVRHDIADDAWLGAIGYVAYVDAPLLSRNASHSDVQRDDEFKRAMRAVRDAVRAMMRSWLESTLLGEDQSWRANPDAFTGVQRHYVEMAARIMLRAGSGRIARSLDALLDVPDMVELAVRRPAKISLRPLWEAYRRHKRCYVATQRYDVTLGDLDDDLIPVIGPSWVLEDVFHGKTWTADQRLQDVANGLKNRREREAMRRAAELTPEEAMIKVRVAHAGHDIHGEFGLARPGPSARRGSTALGWRHEADDNDNDSGSVYNVHVLFLRDGVPLGQRVLASHVGYGVAVVDSQQFEANAEWDDLSPNAASKSVKRMLDDTIVELLEALCTDFANLPPPDRMLDTGFFSVTGGSKRLPGELTALWPSDSLARDARWHVDTILGRSGKIGRERAPWLWTWPLFHLLSGEAVSVAHILGERPAPDAAREPDPILAWRYALEASWGPGTPPQMRVVNVSSVERDILTRYADARVKDGAHNLDMSRVAMERQREREERRQRNLAAARARRQERAVLDARHYMAVVDLEFTGDKGARTGEGQIGIPAYGGQPGYIRMLVDDLPLCDHKFDPGMPIHAIVRSPDIEADDTFEAPRSPAVVKTLEALVTKSLGVLMAALARSKEADTRRGHDIVWSYLATIAPDKSHPMRPIPEPVLDLALLPTVDRGSISLRDAFADAKQHKQSVLVAARSLGRQLQERPILVLDGDQQRVLRRLLNISARDYTRSLQNEEDVLARLDKPRRPPVLQQPAAVRVDIDQQGMRGQIAIAKLMAAHTGKQYSHWLDLQRDGIPIERIPWDVYGAPFIGVLECKEFQPNTTWDTVRRDAAYKKAMRVAQEAVDALILNACTQLARENLMTIDASSVIACLRGIAGQRFQGAPELSLDQASELERALAHAPIWPSADAQRASHTLLELSEHWQKTGTVWLTAKSRGHLAGHRAMVYGGDDIAEHLKQIFGDRVRDGSKVLRRDDLAHQRRINAPALHTGLTMSVMESVAVEHVFDDVALQMRGHVALHAQYRGAPRGIHVTVGLDGKRLCERTIDHPLRGLAVVDCTGLRPNRDWDGMADDRQVRAMDQMIHDVLWHAAAAVAQDADSIRQHTPADVHARAMYLDVLLALHDSDAPKRASLLRAASAAALFRTVTGHAMSLDEIRAHAQRARHVLAVSDRLDRGDPDDGQVIVRADDDALSVLEAVLGRQLRRHDERWQKQLAGQLRRRQTPRVEPNLTGDIAAKLFVQTGSTSALIGLIRPAVDKGFDDTLDIDSKVHLHIDRRKVAERALRIHPSVEVWLDDDRLTPTPDFRNIESDEHYQKAIAVVRDQLPELRARAAAVCTREPTSALRLRLCHYVLDHRASLLTSAKRAPAGPEARLLAEPIWPCLSSAGRDFASTEQLFSAYRAKQLVYVDADARGHAVPRDVLAVRATRIEQTLLHNTFGELRDYTDDLRAMEAHRVFMTRAPVGSIGLRSAGFNEPLVWRHAMDQPGWEGELGLSANLSMGMAVQVYREHRELVRIEIGAPIRALCAVQWSELVPTPSFDDIDHGDTRNRFIEGITHTLWDALIELAHALPEMRARDREPAERILLNAFVAYSQRGQGKPGHSPARERLLTTLGEVPLLPDIAERLWSVKALRAEGEISTITPETARLGANADDRVILVLDDELFQSASRVLRVARYDQRYMEGVEAQRRMARAPTTYKMPRAALCREPVQYGPLRGELALATAVGDGRVGLFSSGRLVDTRAFPEMPGLLGFVDGDLATDRSFARVTLEHEEMRALKHLYHQRLERAVAEAVAYKGRRSSSTWRALRAYVLMYLQRHADDLGRAFGQRREHVMNQHTSIPQPVRSALECPIFELEGGDTVNVATLIAGERPIVVRLPEVKKRRKREPATSLVGDALDIALLTAILGSKTVFSYEDWLASELRAEKQSHKQAAEKAALQEAHVLRRLKSVWREAAAPRAGGHSSSPRVPAMEVSARGDEPLARSDNDARDIGLNSDHPVWKKVTSGIARDPRLILYLAGAVITELALRDGVSDKHDTIALFAGLARHALDTLETPDALGNGATST